MESFLFRIGALISKINESIKGAVFRHYNEIIIIYFAIFNVTYWSEIRFLSPSYF